MPIIEGYDDLTVGAGHWPDARYEATIEYAKLIEGNRQDGTKWYALDVMIESDGLSRSVKVYYPASSAEWQTWKEGKRKATKAQLLGLGIHMSELENESARAQLIGKPVTVQVVTKGDYTNYNFQDASRTEAGKLPGPEQVGIAPVQTTTPASAAASAVVV